MAMEGVLVPEMEDPEEEKEEEKEEEEDMEENRTDVTECNDEQPVAPSQQLGEAPDNSPLVPSLRINAKRTQRASASDNQMSTTIQSQQHTSQPGAIRVTGIRRDTRQQDNNLSNEPPLSTTRQETGNEEATNTSSEKENGLWKRILVLTVFLGLIVAIAVIIALLLVQDKTDKDTTLPVQYSYDIDQELYPLLLQASFNMTYGEENGDANALSLQNQTSIQYQAFEWLYDRTKSIFENTELLATIGRDLNDPMVRDNWLITNYALYILYQTSGGDNWRFDWGWFDSPTLDFCSYIMSLFSDQSWTLWKLGDPICNDQGQLTALSLFASGLEGSLPDEMGLLTSLEFFSVARNSLSGTLPKSFEKLTNLQQLDVSFNYMTGTLPTEVGTLTNLEELWINHNEFTGFFPVEYSNLTSLSLVQIQRTRIEGSIPKQFCEWVDNRNMDLVNSTSTTDDDSEYAIILLASCERVECSCCTVCVDPCAQDIC